MNDNTFSPSKLSDKATSPFRPMLAYDGDIRTFERLLNYHQRIYASYKLDGIRAIVRDGKLISRSGKLIRNRQCQQLFAIPELEDVDGELIVGVPTGNDVFKRTTSGIMTADADVRVWFHAFDVVMSGTFEERQEYLHKQITNAQVLHKTKLQAILVHQFKIEHIADLISREEDAVERGYEGLIVRSPTGNYKFGRSTLKEGGMGKLKRWADAEGAVLGFEEMMHNANAPTIDARGYQVRSSHMENKIGLCTMGKVIIRDAEHGWEVSVGTGFSSEERKEIWLHQDRFLGRILKYKYLPHGTDQAARHPVFVGWRDKDDM